MKVKLLSYTPNPELLCASAALTSTHPVVTSENFKKLDLAKARKILQRVMDFGHTSVIEHASFTFSLENVSRALTHQLVRHRLASYTQQSQRYVAYNTLEHYVTPKSIKNHKDAKETFEDALAKISEAYQKLLKYSIPKEDARFILPNAAMTNIVVTMNARELRRFFNLRCCERAQWEIHETAIEMLKQAKKVAPVLFENAGPFCVEYGYCPEKEKKPSTCNIERIKKQFVNLSS
ncbi:MAG: FAD-dependent thymidylate synthase [Candidatus Bathyarchaeota archaeon]|nr:FAD-dependent thymidylate synthase [Candidatus Bathyarchaeota archaeon]MDH5495102.1 FAD-dependent thymidylate synthase [Candidatus Bathyarchaeota archaeon]